MASPSLPLRRADGGYVPIEDGREIEKTVRPMQAVRRQESKFRARVAA